MTRVAAIQLNSGDDLSLNLEKTAELVCRAQRLGAAVSVLPECFALMPRDNLQRVSCSEPLGGNGRVERAVRQLATDFGMWIISAGVFTAAGNEHKVRNTCFVHDDSGRLVARYDKIHLFDVALNDEEQYRESRYIEPGDTLKVVDSPAGKVGLSICYDVRFPELYRRLATFGAQWFVVPSAFLQSTGRSHWEVLLRARAIENFAYVVAPAQYGKHSNGRRSYGHSMIIDPWGTVLARQADGDGVVVCDLDSEKCNKLRTEFSGLTQKLSLRCANSA